MVTRAARVNLVVLLLGEVARHEWDDWYSRPRLIRAVMPRCLGFPISLFNHGGPLMGPYTTPCCSAAVPP